MKWWTRRVSWAATNEPPWHQMDKVEGCNPNVTGCHKSLCPSDTPPSSVNMFTSSMPDNNVRQRNSWNQHIWHQSRPYQQAISSHQKDTIDLRRLPILISELVLGFSGKLNAWNIPKSFTIQNNFSLAKSPQSVLQVTFFSSSSLGERKPLWPRSSTKCRIQNISTHIYSFLIDTCFFKKHVNYYIYLI